MYITAERRFGILKKTLSYLKSSRPLLAPSKSDLGKAYQLSEEIPGLMVSMYDLHKKKGNGILACGHHGSFTYDNHGSLVIRLGKRISNWATQLSCDAV